MYNWILKILYQIPILNKYRRIDYKDWVHVKTYNDIREEDWSSGSPKCKTSNPLPINTLAINSIMERNEITSKFKVRYARVVLTCYTEGERGCWFAFWAIDDDKTLPEADFEWCSGKSKISMTYHHGWQYKKGLKKSTLNNRMRCKNINGQWHYLTLEFTPYWTKWYVDGILVKRVGFSSSNNKKIIISAKHSGIGGEPDYCNCINKDAFGKLIFGNMMIFEHIYDTK